MRFNLNDLKVLEHWNHVQRMWQGDFLTQNKFGAPHHFRLRNGQNAEIGVQITNYQGISKAHTMIPWYRSLKSNWNIIKTL